MSNSFAFILNPLEIKDGKSPIEIMPTYFFQKADANQINVLKKTWGKLPGNLFWLNSYEYDYGVIGKPNQKSTNLMPKDWKYWVITHDGYTSNSKKRTTFFILECALLLLQNDLEIGPLFFSVDGNNFQWNPRSFYNYFLDYPAGGRPATKITQEEIQEIGTSHSLISDFFKKMNTITIYPEGKKVRTINDDYQENYQHIDHAIRQFVDLKALPRYSGLTIIGLFSIIESLITHNPKQNVEDSLNHQIKTKIPLLRKKFQRTLDYKKHFAFTDEKKLWGSLYDFRSKIVHEGNENIGKTKELKSLDNITDFLKETVKLLILFALKEPQLITDLKEC